jgi:site-specific DNA recombinase
MNAAIYARKSTEQSGVADDAKSVTRQVEHAKAYSATRDWSVADEHVYVDDGISGAKFARRPGLVRLLAALKPHPTFSVLLIADRDRIGREQIETSYVMKQIITAGVRIFECQGDEGREITLGSPTDKIIMAVQDFAAEVEREKARSRTHAALAHRARAGRATGGRTFGYETARAPDGTVTRTIVPAEAEVVRRIFTLTSEGHGRKAIAQRLNTEGAPAPRKAGQMRGWAPSTVRDALANELYRGVLIWNRTRRRDAWGQRRKGRHDVGEVLTVDLPEARIIDAPLWQRAQERLEAGRALYAARNGTRNGGRPASGSASKYLLSGLGECGQCGGSMFVHRRDRSRAATWDARHGIYAASRSAKHARSAVDRHGRCCPPRRRA